MRARGHTAVMSARVSVIDALDDVDRFGERALAPASML
jgi:hypothetical protein